jgi:hypothetical protein
MKFNHLMSGVSVVTVLLGLSFIFYGRWVLSFYGISLEPSPTPRLVAGSSLQPLLIGIAFGRIFGAVLLGIGLLEWLTRNLSNMEAQKTLLLGLFIINMLAFLAVLLQQITLWIYLPPLKTMSARLLAAVFLILSLALGYARFIKAGGSKTAKPNKSLDRARRERVS